MVIWDGCQHVKKKRNSRPARCAGQQKTGHVIHDRLSAISQILDSFSLSRCFNNNFSCILSPCGLTQCIVACNLWILTILFRTQDSDKCIEKAVDDSDGCFPWFGEMWSGFHLTWRRIIQIPCCFRHQVPQNIFLFLFEGVRLIKV